MFVFQFRAGFALNDRGWVLTQYKLEKFSLKTSESYYGNINFTVQDGEAIIDTMSTEQIETVIIAGLVQVDPLDFTAPVAVDFTSFDIVTYADEATNYHLTCLDSGMFIRIKATEFSPGTFQEIFSVRSQIRFN